MTIEHGCKYRRDNEPLKKYLKPLADEIVMPKHKMKRMKEKLSILICKQLRFEIH